MYKRQFHHPPDEVTMDRWMNNWDQRRFSAFVQIVKDSRKAAYNERIIFTGLCQDHGRQIISHWLPIIESIGDCFEDYRILIMENDSFDDTRSQWLHETYRNRRILLLCNDDQPLNMKECRLGIRSSTGDKEKNLKERVNHMADLRDLYLKRVRRKWSNYQYMVVIDWDLIGQLSLEGFFHALAFVRDGMADGVAVNSLYYKDKMWHIFDTYPLLNHHRCNEIYEKKKKLDVIIDKQWRQRMTKTLIAPVQVESAFGGMAIYSLPRVLATESFYTIPDLEKLCDIQCEHTSFHRLLHIFIDPWFVLLLSKNLH
jgi:hypothetical protein